MNEIVHHSGSQLAIRNDQPDWTQEQATALLEMFNLGNAPHSVIRSYFHVCQTTGLDPFKRQIHLIERQGKYSPQTSIDGFRIIRDRSKVYDGDETFWCGEDGVWTDAWLRHEPPTAAKFVLYVKGRSHPVTAVARWAEYVQTKANGEVTKMWAKMGAHMLAKVAEALAIRKAFPDDTGGLYTDDEMMQAEVIHEDGSTQSAGRTRSPGLLDMEPPVAPAQYGAQPPGVGGGFMDASPATETVNGEVIEDAVIAPEAHTVAPVAVEQEPQLAEPMPEQFPPAEAAPVMDMQPEPRQAPPHGWALRLAEFCEKGNPQVHELRALFDEASSANALGEMVAWVGDPRAGGMTLGDAIFAIKGNLENGLALLEGLA